LDFLLFCAIVTDARPLDAQALQDATTTPSAVQFNAAGGYRHD